MIVSAAGRLEIKLIKKIEITDKSETTYSLHLCHHSYFVNEPIEEILVWMGTSKEHIILSTSFLKASSAVDTHW